MATGKVGADEGTGVNLGTYTFTEDAVTKHTGRVTLNTSAGAEISPALESGGNLAAAATSLAVVDDWDESDRAKVNPIVGQAGVAAGAGAVSAATQRTTLASDDPAVALLGTIDTDTGNIATNTTNIPNVIGTDGAAAPSRSLVIAGVTSGGVQQTIETNASGHVNVADGGSSLTVDAADLDIRDLTATDVVTVTGGAGQTADVKVTLDSETVVLGAGTAAFGKLAANSGVDIGDVDVTSAIITGGATAHDAVDAGNPIKIGAKAESALSTATMVADGDRTELYGDIDGAQLVRLSRPLGDMVTERVTDTGGSSTAFTNFGATASTRNVVTDITVFNSSATAGFLDLRDGTAGSVLWTIPLPAGSGATLHNPNGIFRTSANTALAYDVSAPLTTIYISVGGFKSKV